MKNQLSGMTVAILVTDGFEQIELTSPKQALEEAGVKTQIVSLKEGKIQGYHHDEKGDAFDVDMTVDSAKADDFDGLMLPGGVKNPDALRMNEKAVAFVKAFFAADKSVSAICHGPWMLVEADVVRGRTVTSWPSIRTDLKNAGAKVLDQEVVVDKGLVTSRKPDDLPAFNAKIVEELGEQKRKRKAA
jgi:protease I